MSQHMAVDHRRKSGVELEEYISATLRIGGIVSGAVIGLGVILLIVTGRSGYPAGVYPLEVGEVLVGAALLRPYAIIQFGLILLMATPFLRVILSVIIFAKRRDYVYTALTFAVLTILVVGLILGGGGH